MYRTVLFTYTLAKRCIQILINI